MDCNGDTDGQVTASQAGGTSPYTYSWNTGETNAVETNLGANTYSVTVTDQNGCTDSASVTLSQPTLLAASATGVDETDNLSNGSVAGSATGGNSPYMYSWNTGGTASSETGLIAGTYSVTITDQNGCTDSASTTISNVITFSVNTTVNNNILCNGGSNGSITASIQNGSSPFSYVWSNGSSTTGTTATSNTLTGLVAGSYIVTVTDNGGLTATSSVTITQPTALITSTVVDSNVSCNGYSDGGATASGTGGTMPYTYGWNNGATTASIIGVTAGTYSVTITDANGCMDSSSVTITQPTSFVSATVLDSNVTCNTFSDGGATTSGTGGTMPYNYLWSNSATTASITGVVAGTYSVTITDANGCTDSSSITVTEPAVLVSSSIVDSNVTCNTFSDGGATASGTGGTMPYNYLWSNSATTASITGVTAGTHSVTITDANGCTDSASVTISQPAALVAASVLDSNTSCNGFSDGGATASAMGGTGAYSYSWSNGATNASITGVVAGTYSVTIMDANGCTDSSSVTITEPVVLVSSTIVDSNTTCNGFSNGGASASATGGTGSYTYSWSNSATTASITGVGAGTYSITITDANGCTDSSSVTVTEPAVLVSSAVLDSNDLGNGGGVTASATGGTMAYAYNWSNGGTTASIAGLAAGTYSVTVTDANGCTDSSSVEVTAGPVTVVTLDNNVSCNGSSDGGATASSAVGVMPFTFLWSNSATTASITGVVAGTYSVTITDANGLTDSTSITITEPAALVASSVVDSNISCNGLSDGGATSSAVGGIMPYTYAWSNGDTTSSITGVLAGTYSVTITDANGCTVVSSATVTEPAVLAASSAVTSNISCNGLNDGSGTASATGGTMPYAYLWSNGFTTSAITGVVTGTYSVTITDANGCSDTASITITEPAALLASSVVDSNISCNGLSDGGVSSSAVGGTMPYAYGWSTGDTTSSIAGVAAGTYSITITDANGCIAVSSATVTEPAALVASSMVDNNISCNGLSDGGGTSSAVGGTMPYTYAWSNSDTTSSITGVMAGTYSVTITDANGCTDSTSITITEPAALVASSIVDNNISCNGLSDGGGTSSAVGGTMPYTYAWSNSDTTSSITGVMAGTYSVTITDANGCTDSTSITITEPAALVASNVVDNNISCNGLSDGGATSSAVGGTMPYTYAWSNSATTASITGVVAGTYSVTITDANGCTDSTSITITEPVALVASSVVDSNVTCNGSTNGGGTASAVGGTMPYTYAWSNSATTASITGVAAGSYTVTITDANGCTSTSSITITEPTALVASSVVDSNTTCNTFSDGGATASAMGGTMPYTYGWSNAATTASITGVAAGTYSVTITDANGCTAITSSTITDPGLAVSTSTVSNVLCFGGSTGSALASGSGGFAPYSYSWSNGGTNASVGGLVAGTYTVTLTDANGCLEINTVVVSQPNAAISLQTQETPVTCFGQADGSIAATAAGGTAPYSYLWSDGSTGANRTGLAAGSYTVTTTDDNGCTTIQSVVIIEPNELLTSLVGDDLVCFGEATGSLVSTGVTGGTSPYTYSWSTGATTDTISGLAQGSYTLTVSDANGCTYTVDGVISENEAIQIALSEYNTNCEGGQDGRIDAIAYGGTPGYQYAWSNGSNLRDIENLSAGVYTLTVTDSLGCENTDSETITFDNPLPQPNLGNDTAYGIPSLIVLDPGTPGDDHLWSTGDFTPTLTVELLSTQTIWVQVTTDAGCVNSDTITIEGLLGVDGIANTYDIKLFPNPTNGDLNIQMHNIHADEVIVQVVDFAGKLVYDREWNYPSEQFMETIDMSANSQGVYFVNVFIDGHRHTERITVY